MNRNLYNSTDDNNIQGFPIVGTPANNNLLIYQNGQFVYSAFVPGTGVVSVASSGIGQSIVKDLSGNVLTLKTIYSDESLAITSSTNEVIINLGPNLYNVQNINNNPTQNLNINISDNGAFTGRDLNVFTTYGNTGANPLKITNTGDVYLPTINNGTPVSNKYLARDISGKIIENTVADGESTTASNLGTGVNIYAQEIGNDLQFKTLLVGVADNISILNGPQEIVLDLSPSLDNISSINQTSNNTPLEIFSPFYLPNLTEAQTGKAVYWNPTNHLLSKGDVIQSIFQAGIGEATYYQTVNGVAFMRSFNTDASMTTLSTTTTTTFGVANAQPNITDINQSAGSLNLNCSQLFVPNLNTLTRNGLVLSYDSGTRRVGTSTAIATVTASGAGVSLINNVNPTTNLQLRSLVAAENIDLNLNLGLGEIDIRTTPNLNSITAINDITNTNTVDLCGQYKMPNLAVNNAVQYDLCFGFDGKLYKSNLAPGGANIYNSNGQFSDAIRTVTGLNNTMPLGSENQLVLNKINLCFENNIAYNPTNSSQVGGSNADDWILAGSNSSNLTRAITAPYSRLSQKVDFSLGATYGAGYDICKYLNNPTESGAYNLEIEIHQKENFLVSSQVAGKWILTSNFDNITPVTEYSLKPVSTINACSLTNSLVSLGVVYDTGGFILRARQSSRSSGSITFYTAFIKDLSLKSGSVVTTGGALVAANLSTNYLNEDILEADGIGLIPNIIYNQKITGKSVRFDIFQQFSVNADNRTAQLNILLNATVLFSIALYAFKKDQNVSAVANKCYSWNALMNLNILNLNTINTISFNVTGTDAANFLPASNPYRFSMSYY